MKYQLTQSILIGLILIFEFSSNTVLAKRPCSKSRASSSSAKAENSNIESHNATSSKPNTTSNVSTNPPMISLSSPISFTNQPSSSTIGFKSTTMTSSSRTSMSSLPSSSIKSLPINTNISNSNSLTTYQPESSITNYMSSSEPSTSLPKSSSYDGLSSSTRVPLSSFTNNDTEPIIFNLPNSSTTTNHYNHSTLNMPSFSTDKQSISSTNNASIYTVTNLSNTSTTNIMSTNDSTLLNQPNSSANNRSTRTEELSISTTTKIIYSSMSTIQSTNLKAPPSLHSSTNIPLSTTTTSITSCNCIGSIQTGCLPYDSRLQASTLEEAIASFPDLIRINHLHQPETMEEQVICETKECRDCRKEMRKKLASIGLLPAAIESALAAQGNNTNCTKYSFNSEGSKRKSKSDSSESKEDDEDHRKKKNKNTSEKYEKESKKKHDSNSSEEKKQKKHRRNRRQMTSSGVADPNLLGTRYILSCSQKGIDLDPSGFASFCSTCWVWRKLPDNYSPQYINELVCDNTDNSCLSGHATCNTGQHMVEVIRNDNGAQTRIALAAGSYCECKATMNSALISLIDGSGVSSTILPIGQMP